MDSTQNVANKIKKIAKAKNIQLKTMLADLQLNKNSIALLANGQHLSYISIAKIADYLDCSVDYLLGRTNDPQSHKHSRPAVLVDNQPRFLIRRAGRDGSFVEEYVTKSELDKIQSLPEADDI